MTTEARIKELGKLMAASSPPPSDMTCSFAAYRQLAGNAKADEAIAAWGFEPEFVLIQDGTVYPAE